MTPTSKPESIELPPHLKALADPTRLAIMLMLERKRRTVGEIVSAFHLSQPTISRHLQTLTQTGLVRRRKNGQFVHYEVDAERIRSVCLSLVSCFPCCCVAVAVAPETAPGCATTESKDSSTRRKGGTS